MPDRIEGIPPKTEAELQRLRMSRLVRITGEAAILAEEVSEREADMKDRVAVKLCGDLLKSIHAYFRDIE